MKIFDKMRSTIETTSITSASQNISILSLALRLPNMDCYCHCKSLNLRDTSEKFKAGFQEMQRNIQTEGREFISYINMCVNDTYTEIYRTIRWEVKC